jgi:predicted transglutaminase-like cysteine proteinase
MSNKLFCNRERPPQATSRGAALVVFAAALVCLACGQRAFAGDAPAWMHALVNAPLPAYDEKTDAVLLYSETNVTVVSADRIRTQVREAYKILRPRGRGRGTVVVPFNPQRKIRSLHGWCIPAQGKDYEVKDKDAIEGAYLQTGELMSDVKQRVLSIPAPDPGNIVGYEYEVEEQPLFLQRIWYFQEADPMKEGRYSLQLPPGWEYKVSWLNHAEVKPVQTGVNSWQWTVNDVNGLREEPFMPPLMGVASQMIVSFFTSSGVTTRSANADWDAMGKWYFNLVGERVDASAEIKQQVSNLTASKATPLQKMQAIGQFVQHDIRYVSIDLGIGGMQPHSAPDVFAHRYGDCKDKATLVRSMLREIGVDSYHVVINAERGSVTGDMPAHNGFNHVITAIKLPADMADPSLIATMQHPKLGRILFFDPTNDLIPFGQLPGYLQANYGLLVTPDGGELVELPQQPSSMNGIQRTAKLTLDPAGTLKGTVKETRLGERAASERWRQRTVTKETDRIKSIEDILSSSLSSFHITHAALINLQQTDRPFGFDYSFESPNYVKNAGDLLLVRPRVIGNKGDGFLETKEPRKFPIEFEGPVRDTDTFEITIPAGYVVDDLPPPVDADFSFASYHAKTVVTGNVVGYTRTFEVKELSVPVAKAEDLKKFYRIIAGDERNTVVLKPAP